MLPNVPCPPDWACAGQHWDPEMRWLSPAPREPPTPQGKKTEKDKLRLCQGPGGILWSPAVHLLQPWPVPSPFSGFMQGPQSPGPPGPTHSPSSTPVTMEAKLSSSRIMSAACLETSEPAMPMATPMSAFFRAGESFTPSPVTATMAPWRERG